MTTSINIEPRMFRNEMKISSRLTLSFALMGLLIGMLGAVCFVKARSVDAKFTLVVDGYYPKVHALNDIDRGIAVNAPALRDLALADSDAVRTARLAEIAGISAMVGNESRCCRKRSRLAMARRCCPG